jgi:trehalose 6-phosphate phosphatase
MTLESVVASATHLTSSTSETSAPDLLAPLRVRPDTSAVLCDVDGTIAPIVVEADEASVPQRGRELLEALGRRYALVGCVSGRRATDARRVVGVDSISYIGNHGLEYLRPRAERAETVWGISGHQDELRRFARDAHTPELRRIGVRLEDKRSIWAFHWRGATDEAGARQALEQLANAALERGFEPRWGRKVLEIRPRVGVDKGTAVASLLGESEVRAALYAGDDTTDLDAFRALRHLREAEALEHVICVGVRSEEGPAEITDEADLVVDGPGGTLELLTTLLS